MPLDFISAEERLARRPKINIAVFGQSGVGKTFQCRFLNPETTLFIDGEAGTLTLNESPPWKGTVFEILAQSRKLNVHPWVLARAIACLLGGPDPSDVEGPYSERAYQQYIDSIGPPDQFDRFHTLFVDSVTVVSRWCFAWAQTQPEAFSEKTGKPDTRGAYGLLGREMVTWLTALQHQPKSIIVVGILDERTDDFGRTTYQPQIVGGMTGRELPGIFDAVVTLSRLTTEDGTDYRAFVCQHMNPYGFPAKTRGGSLDVVEEPDLSKLMAKLANHHGVSA